MGNKYLTELPESLDKFTKLVKLDLHGNKLKKIPESIGNLECLKELDLSLNMIEVLPESIGNLKALEIVNLRKNNLKNMNDEEKFKLYKEIERKILELNRKMETL